MIGHAKASSAASTHRGNSRFSLGVIAATLVCAAAFLGIGAPAASAAPAAQPGYGSVTTFGQGELSNYIRSRNSVAVDSHGNIFATNTLYGFIPIYSPDAAAGGVPLALINNNEFSFYAEDVAIDPTSDTLYAQDVAISPSIRRFTSDGQSPPTYTVEPGFELPPGEGFAIDPTTHDILVADPGAEGIRRYGTTGALLETIPTPSMAPQRIAIASDGSFYVSQESKPNVLHLSGTGTLLGEVQNVGTVRALVVNSAGDLVVATGGRIKTYSSNGQFRSETASPSGNEVSLAVDPGSGRLYGYTSSSINVYDPAIWPGAEGLTVSDVTAHSVHVSAEVDPGTPLPSGSEAHFEYSADGGANWKSTPSEALSGPTTAEADITGLLANSAFKVRFVASNSLTSHILEAVDFSTPEIAPEVITGRATDISETSAVLNGTVNPAGLQTTYHFEYGTTAAYGTRIPAGLDATAGKGLEPRSFNRTITGLQPGTIYHYRIVAENAIGVTEGPDETFTTRRAGEVPQRVYEQVTPVDKNGIAIESGFGFYAKADGNGMAYLTKGGSAGAPLNARAITTRGTVDWEAGPGLDPPLDVVTDGIVTQATLGLAPDFTKAFVVSNRKLTPGAEAGAANLYIFDIASGDYTLVGKSPAFPIALNFYTGFGVGRNLIVTNSDMSSIVFYSQLPLTEEAPFDALYHWSKAGGLEIASISPGPAETPVTIPEPSPGLLPWASEDGSRIYFGSLETERGVYLREAGETKAISVSEVSGEPTGPQPGEFFGTSKDGRYAFFATLEGGVKLTADAPGDSGDLFRYDAVEETLEYLGDNVSIGLFTPNASYAYALGVSEDGGTFYFRDASAETKVWREGELQTVSSESVLQGSATISPDGRYFAYREGGDLHLYDSVAEEDDCASCFPDGSSGQAELPNLTERTIGEHLPQSVTNSGQFFFTSTSRLVAADVNGVADVYEYKNGKASLVSPGNAPFPATFGDISKDGSDVFFTTQQKLVGRDNDGSVDIYDARIGGGLAAQNPSPPQECLRDDCKAAPSAGVELPFGGSEALSGPENVKPAHHKKCGKGKGARKLHGKVRCVKKHKVKKHRKHKSKHSTNHKSKHSTNQKPNQGRKGGNR